MDEPRERKRLPSDMSFVFIMSLHSFTLLQMETGWLGYGRLQFLYDYELFQYVPPLRVRLKTPKRVL